jgi:hypothetical protein
MGMGMGQWLRWVPLKGKVQRSVQGEAESLQANSPLGAQVRMLARRTCGMVMWFRSRGIPTSLERTEIKPVYVHILFHFEHK